jgi:hypothetical protein
MHRRHNLHLPTKKLTIDEPQSALRVYLYTSKALDELQRLPVVRKRQNELGDVVYLLKVRWQHTWISRNKSAPRYGPTQLAIILQ